MSLPPICAATVARSQIDACSTPIDSIHSPIETALQAIGAAARNSHSVSLGSFGGRIGRLPPASASPAPTAAILRPPKLLDVYYDVGYGNCLEIRGDGPGMSWDVGIPLTCKGSDCWTGDLPYSASGYQYKVVMKKSSGEILWEYLPNGENRSYSRWDDLSAIEINDVMFEAPAVYVVQPRLYTDPLSWATKRKIQRYVIEHLLKSDGRPIEGLGSREEALRFQLSKTYGPIDTEYASIVDAYHIAEGHSERSLASLREVLKNPNLQTARFGIDPANALAVHAAQVFMKAAIRKVTEDLRDIDELYIEKMSGEKKIGPGRTPLVSYKHEMLSRAAISAMPESPAALDILLANTRIFQPKLLDTVSVRQIFDSLLKNPETAHVLYALAILFRQQKGNILINAENSTLVGCIAGHLKGRVAAASCCGFTRNHTIYLRDIGSRDEEYTPSSLFIHEALHYIFKHVVGNNYSPVKGEEEKILDEALELDRLHRASIAGELRSSSMYRTMVNALEENAGYFGKGFDINDAGHRRIMRVEAIVRVMEKIAEGIPIKEIRAVAPHLCDFYFKYSKPMIERNVLLGLSELSGTGQSDVIKGLRITEASVHYDVGFGNSLEIRGNGPGMSWDCGIALNCLDKDFWRAAVYSDRPFEYKFVIRRADGTILWEELESNRVFVPGTDIVACPKFS